MVHLFAALFSVLSLITAMIFKVLFTVRFNPTAAFFVANFVHTVPTIFRAWVTVEFLAATGAFLNHVRTGVTM